MSRRQWGHGYRSGHEAGEQIGEMLGQGSAEVEFGRAGDRLEMLSRGLRAEANGSQKSSAWWALYACLLADELHEIAVGLPSVLAAFSDQPLDSGSSNEGSSGTP